MINTDFKWLLIKFAELLHTKVHITHFILLYLGSLIWCWIVLKDINQCEVGKIWHNQKLFCYLIRFVASARQLAKALEVPLVNDLGYTKRYVRCLQVNLWIKLNNFILFQWPCFYHWKIEKWQIAEVVNCMKDLIDYSRQTGTGPMGMLWFFFPHLNDSSESLDVKWTFVFIFLIATVITVNRVHRAIPFKICDLMVLNKFCRLFCLFSGNVLVWR